MKRIAQQFLKLLEGMSEGRVKEIMEYASFIKWQERKRKEKIIEFDAWARNLAKRRGFDRLTEEEVTQIVHQARQGK